MKLKLRLQLSIMMFLQICLYGMIVPVLSLYLRKILGFSQIEIGFVLAMFPVSTILSPVIGAVIADRFISAERVYGVCMFASSVLLYVLSLQSEFVPFLVCYLFFMLFVGLTIPLSDTIVFHNIKERHEYGSIRIWGSVGWVTSGVLFSFFWLKGGTGAEIPGRLESLLLFSSVLAFVSFMFSFLLPASNVKKQDALNIKTILPVESLRILFRKEVFAALLISLLFSFNTRHYFNGASQFLSQTGYSDGDIYIIMNIAVLVEVVVFYFLSHFIRRFGFKVLFVTGLILQIVKYTLFSLQPGKIFPLIGFVLEGGVYPFCIASVLMFIDSQCTKNDRTGLHQFFTILVYGIAGFVGDLVSGSVAAYVSHQGIVNYRVFWLVPLVSSIIMLIWISFRKFDTPVCVDEVNKEVEKIVQDAGFQ